MTLSSLVVSRDWPEVSVLECILGGLHIGVEVEPELDRARARMSKSKIDALILDSDLDGTANFLRQMGSEMNTVPLVIIRNPRGRKRVEDSAATFVFEKPISVEQAVHTLSAARNMILDGRLRYHRHTLDMPVSLTAGKTRLDAHLLNLSQGGMGIRLHRPLPLSGTVQVSFTLPRRKRALKIAGDVVWNRQGTAGIRFADFNDRVKRDLQIWLAQQYLAH
jgi:hypothetical protein